MPVKEGFEVRFLLLIILLCAPAIHACCPTDRDDFADEVEDESVLDLIMGQVDRPAPEFWRERQLRIEKSGLAPVEKDIELARVEDQLNQQDQALTRLERRLEDPKLDETARSAVHAVRAEIALNLWWMGGSDRISQELCLLIALDGFGAQTDARYMKMVATWARDASVDQDSLYIPDFFGLRFATNKSADRDTGELRKRGLEDAEEWLLQRIRHHGAWENFDVIYSLSMLYVVQGRQNLAYFTRLRAWDLHAQGNQSKARGIENIPDIKPLTILRQITAGELKPVKVVDDENQQVIIEQYTARKEYTRSWKQARAAYAASRLAAGVSPLDGAFWSTFSPPPSQVPPLNPPKAPPTTDAQETTQDSAEVTGKTWVMLGILLVLLVLGGITKARLSRSANRLLESNNPEETK